MLRFCARYAMYVFSVCCKKTSDSMLENGAPIVLDNYPERRAGDVSPIFQHAIRNFLTTHRKNTHFTYLTQKHKITNYFQYVDDILLIFYSNHTDIQAILTNLNSIHPNSSFTAT
jgi:hypothetical protein